MPIELAPEELRRLLDYNPETGVLTWKVREGLGKHNFNTRFAGKRAGYVDVKRADGFRYVCVRINKKLYLAHRVCWAMHFGEWPGDNHQIDHIDSDCTNNAISNLRLVTHRGNGMNIKKKKSNTSGVTGVWWHNQIGRWCAEIMVRGKKVYLGTFELKEDAAKAREKAERKYGFHPLHGRKTFSYHTSEKGSPATKA